MNGFLETWHRWCAVSSALRFVDVNLRGTGQVMFQNNPVTGALFLAAIAWGSVAGGAPEVLIGGLLGLVSATLTALWLRVDQEGLAAGLYGYNGILVGLALPTFLPPSALLWSYVVLGAGVSVVAMLGTVNVTRTWRVSALTFPFVLTTWVLLLAAFAFAGLGGGVPSFSADIEPLAPGASDPLDLAGFLSGILKSISQVFLKGNGVSALLLLAGLAVGSVPAAMFAVGGAVLAVSSAHLFGAESALISAEQIDRKSVVAYAALGTLFTVVVQAAMNVAFAPLGIPALTAPFVLTSWLFLLPQQHLSSDANH